MSGCILSVAGIFIIAVNVITPIVYSMGIDTNINCVLACQSISECSSDPLSHLTYCKYWQDPPTCFGIYIRSDGTACFHPNDPSCNDWALERMTCDRKIAYSSVFTTYTRQSHESSNIDTSPNAASTLGEGLGDSTTTSSPSPGASAATAISPTIENASTTSYIRSGMVTVSPTPLSDSELITSTTLTTTTDNHSWATPATISTPSSTPEVTADSPTTEESTASTAHSKSSTDHVIPSNDVFTSTSVYTDTTTMGVSTSISTTSIIPMEPSTTSSSTMAASTSSEMSDTVARSSDSYVTFGTGTVVLYPFN